MIDSPCRIPAEKHASSSLRPPTSTAAAKGNAIQKAAKWSLVSIAVLLGAFPITGCRRQPQVQVVEQTVPPTKVHRGTAEWTRFRGPHGSGSGNFPHLPDDFSANDFNWRVPLPGGGHSSPVVWGDRVFVTANPKGTTQRVVLCLSTRTGEILWSKTYDASGYQMMTDDSYATSSPAVDAERVYFHWASTAGSGLVALDQDTGNEVWKVELAPHVSEVGSGTSPIVVEDMVILNFDQDKPPSFMLAVDARTGKERWRWDHEGTRNTPGTPTTFINQAGEPQILVSTSSIGLCSLDARKGKLIWQIPDLMKRRCVASPIVTDSGLVVAQCGEGRAETYVEVVRMAPDGRSAEKAYEILRVGGNVPTPIAVGGLLFLWKESSFVTCIRTDTNEQIWSDRTQGSYYGSPIHANGRLYNVNTRGDLVVISATEEFKIIARIPLGESSYATPAISEGRMYIRTFTHLVSIGKQPIPSE